MVGGGCYDHAYLRVEDELIHRQYVIVRGLLFSSAYGSGFQSMKVISISVSAWQVLWVVWVSLMGLMGGSCGSWVRVLFCFVGRVWGEGSA